MKVVGDDLRLINYEERKDEDITKEIYSHTFMAKFLLMNLIYDINNTLCHKMNFIIIGIQILVLFISSILQLVLNEYKHIISLTGALISVLMMILVVINVKLSNKAITEANKQRSIIESHIDKIKERK